MNSKIENKKLTGERLRLAREMAGLSQNQAAKLMDVSRPTITEIEAGRRNVTSVELSVFSDLYNVNILWLLGRSEADSAGISSTMSLAARELQNMDEKEVEKLMKILSSMKREGIEK